MIDLSAVLKRLRREDPCLRGTLDSLARCLGQRMEEGECCRAVYSVLITLAAYSMVADARGAERISWEAVLSGRAFRELGILNFCPPILLQTDAETGDCIENLCAALERDDTIRDAGEFVRAFRSDDLKGIYELMIPESVRAAQGEYFTPNWLAECIVENALDAAAQPVSDLRFMDPTCGAGTFLSAVTRRGRQEGGQQVYVAGFDISPTAVLTARTSYLAVNLDRLEEQVLIPVYRCDILRFPTAEDGMLSVDPGIRIPLPLCEKLVCEKRYEAKAILPYTDGDREMAFCVLDQIFAFFEPQADVLLGNPPWVNWEALSVEERERERGLWMEYGLYNGQGKNVRFLKEDVSVLMTAVVMERFLRDGGILSFALRQVVFKSEKNGAMFRKFRLQKSGTPFRVLRVDDLGKIKPFAGVNIRTALVLIRKNEEHRFPVPYFCWARKNGFLHAARTPEVSVDTLCSFVERTEMLAFPADRSDPASLWVNAPAQRLAAVEKVLGSNGYKARSGVFTGGANAVYWLDVMGTEGDTLLVRNAVGRAKRRTESVEQELERTHVYPLVQGHDIAPWRVGQSGYILCPHTEESRMWPVKEQLLRKETPKTWAYLSRFRAELDARRGFAGWDNALRDQRFYAILHVGDYTFSKYKVAWRYIAQSFITAVIEERVDSVLGKTLCIPNEKVMYVGTDSREEAFYLCGILSSLPVSCCVRCYMNPTSISAHVLSKLHIPTFDPHDPLHRRISALCEEGHRETDPQRIAALHAAVDRAAAEIYGMGEGELRSLMD